MFSTPDRHSGAARTGLVSSIIETLCGLRLRLALLVILAVALPTLMFLRHAAIERDGLVAEAKLRVLRLARDWADHEHELTEEARILVETLARGTAPLAGGDLCASLLGPGRRREPGMLGLSVIRPDDASLLCSESPASLPAQPLEHWSFLKDLGAMAGFQISDYTQRRDTLRPTFYAGMKINTGAGQPIALVLALDLGWIEKLVARNDKGLDGKGLAVDAMVVDRTGTILMHSADSGSLTGLRLVDHPVMPRLMIEPEGTAIGSGPDGIERLYGFAQMPETGTKLIVGLASSAVLGPATAEVHNTLVALGLVALLALVLGAIGAQFLVFRWVDALTRAARKIGAGNFGETLSVSRAAGEFRMLAAAFNQMSADLSTHERELADSEKRFRDIAEVSGDWFWEIDADLRTTYVSDQLAAVTGIEPAALIGQPFEASTTIGMTQESLATLRAACAMQRPFRGLVCTLLPEVGAPRYWLLSGKPIFDADGHFAGFRGSGADITAMKQAEQALIEAKSAAEAANRAKSRFLTTMSHELRTPLNAVIGFADLMTAQALGPIGDPRYQSFAKDIGDSGRHLLSLISDILDMSKIDADLLPLAEEPIDLTETIASCLRTVSMRADTGEIQLTSRIATGSRTLRGDPRRFSQILVNLLSNAIRFTPPGGSVELSATIGANGDFSLQIADTGVGIAEEDLAKVLQPFGQADSGLDRRHDGTGLGLPLTKRLVELHGGTLSLSSRLGAGTTVTVSFPAERMVAEAA